MSVSGMLQCYSFKFTERLGRSKFFVHLFVVFFLHKIITGCNVFENDFKICNQQQLVTNGLFYCREVEKLAQITSIKRAFMVADTKPKNRYKNEAK